MVTVEKLLSSIEMIDTTSARSVSEPHPPAHLILVASDLPTAPESQRLPLPQWSGMARGIRLERARVASMIATKPIEHPRHDMCRDSAVTPEQLVLHQL